MNVPQAKLRKLDAQLERNDVEGARATLRPLLSRKAKSAFRKGLGAAHKAKMAEERRRNEVESADLRAKVQILSGGLCELQPKIPHLGGEPHHLLSGSTRLIDEAIENVVWTCRYHHDDYHRHPSRYIQAVKDRCERHGFPVPERILRLERRMASRPAPQAPSGPSLVHEPVRRPA